MKKKDRRAGASLIVAKVISWKVFGHMREPFDWKMNDLEASNLYTNVLNGRLIENKYMISDSCRFGFGRE